MAQEIFNAGGVRKEKTWTEETRQRQKIPSTIKISRTCIDQEILRKRQKAEKETIKYVRPTLDLLSILASSSTVLALDVIVEVGKGSNRQQVMVVMVFSKLQVQCCIRCGPAVPC